MSAKKTLRTHGIEIGLFEKSLLAGGHSFFLKAPADEEHLVQMRDIVKMAFVAGMASQRRITRTAVRDFFRVIGGFPE